ncbi:MAG: endonuclease/exonuclease/phosphatase family protein [Acidimicrobiia bacterium]|nr:endonuclease/exonuclease/phosphatase family protein [Acidimicrobiia bacterium]
MVVRGRSSATVSVGQAVIGFGLITVGVVATLATVLGFFGSAWWLFDFAANFRAHLAVVLLLVALTYALLFSKAMGLFFMAMAIINGLLVLPMYTDSPAEAANGSPDLTIVSFNVGQRASIRETTFRWVDTVQPDIVVLVDSTEEWSRTEQLGSGYNVQTDIPLDRTYGITVLSNEAVDTELLRASSVRDYVVRIEAAVGDQPVVVYAIQARRASNVTDAGYRDEYLEDVSRMVQGETDPTVVVGDFQAAPWSHAFRSMESDAELVNSMRGFGLQTTWPANRWAFFRLPVDHLLHSEQLTTVDRWLGPLFGVDHRPIVVTINKSA